MATLLFLGILLLKMLDPEEGPLKLGKGLLTPLDRVRSTSIA